MQALLNCSLKIKLKEENQTLKQCSTQEAFRKIEEIMIAALDEVMPPKQPSNKPIRRCWIKIDMENSCVEKQKSFQAYLKLNIERDRSIYIKQTNIIKTLVRKTKHNFFANLFSKDNDS